MTIPRMTRENLPKGACLCDYCSAKCCKYFALPIEKPETLKDFDFMRWFLLHDKASVFVEDGSWYLLVHTHCKHLQPDNRCGIYFTRPEICREYSTDNCEYDEDSTYEKYFETAEQVAEYVEATVGQDEWGCTRTPQPPMLPILTT
jgi:Fe-S-cluster containining protein